MFLETTTVVMPLEREEFNHRPLRVGTSGIDSQSISDCFRVICCQRIRLANPKAFHQQRSPTSLIQYHINGTVGT